MNVIDEPIGENCISGSVKIEWWIDSDSHGTLDETEVSGSNYVCNGVTQADEFSFDRNAGYRSTGNIMST